MPLPQGCVRLHTLHGTLAICRNPPVALERAHASFLIFMNAYVGHMTLAYVALGPCAF